MWGVLFLSLILSSFQMIILPSSDVDKRGWDSAHPAFSCKEILDSGHSKGDGEYWIDPEKSGNPLRVYCDMSRYGGKWISLFIWDTRTLTGVYLTWNSFYWNVLVLAICPFSTKILVMFFNRNCKKIIYHYIIIIYYKWLSRACRFEHNRTACASCLEFDSVIGPLTGQLTRHAVWGDRTRHVRALLSRISPSKLLFFVFMKTYNWYLVSS